MKISSITIAASAAFFALLSCTKSTDIIRDNTVPTGLGSYPVSTNALVDQTTVKTLATAAPFTSFAAGYLLKTEIQFFSQSPVKEINLYNTVGTTPKTKVSTLPYAPAYSNIKKLDTLIIPYTVPAGQAVGTAIKLEIEILNENALSVTRTATIRTL